MNEFNICECDENLLNFHSRNNNEKIDNNNENLLHFKWNFFHIIENFLID